MAILASVNQLDRRGNRGIRMRLSSEIQFGATVGVL